MSTSTAVTILDPAHSQALEQYRYDPEVINKAVMLGDMKKMDSAMRLDFYRAVCLSVGLNPLTQPFTPLERQDKTIWLYANATATQQLAKLHQVGFRDMRRVHETVCGEPLYRVETVAFTPDGRSVPAQAVVSLTKKKREQRGTWPDGNPKFVDALDEDGEPLLVPLRGEALANALMRADCVPLDSEMLTRNGWQAHDRLVIGEEVLAYDCDTDQCRWAPLEHVTVFPEAVTVEMGTDLHHFRCTPDHSWAVERSKPYRPDRRGSGTRGPRGPYATRGPLRALIQAHAITTSQRIILAAPAESGMSALSAAEAAVLGWIMTDGTLQRRKSFVRLGICQSKEENFEAIETALTGTGYAVSKSIGKPTTRDFGGYISECKPQVWWYLSTHDSRALLTKAGIQSPADMPALVTRLSTEARSAMFAAMMAADGDARGRFGKKRKPGVMDAWQILATLEGYALGKMGKSTGSDVPVQVAMKHRYIAGSNVRLTNPLVEPVWCPTTQYGTWVMRQNGQVSITGNTKCLRRATLALIGLGWIQSEFEGERVRLDLQTGELVDESSGLRRRLLAERSEEQGKSTDDHIADLYGDRTPRPEAPRRQQPGVSLPIASDQASASGLQNSEAVSGPKQPVGDAIPLHPVWAQIAQWYNDAGGPEKYDEYCVWACRQAKVQDIRHIPPGMLLDMTDKVYAALKPRIEARRKTQAVSIASDVSAGVRDDLAWLVQGLKDVRLKADALALLEDAEASLEALAAMRDDVQRRLADEQLVDEDAAPF